MLAQLNSLGVFSVNFGTSEDEDSMSPPSQAQLEAYRNFIANEEAVCEQLVDFIFSYYNFTFEEEPYLFEDVRVTNADHLPRLIEFSRLKIPAVASNDESPLIFHFHSHWDPEHGFVIVYFGGEVIESGSADDAHHLLRYPETGAAKPWMSDVAFEARKSYVAGAR